MPGKPKKESPAQGRAEEHLQCVRLKVLRRLSDGRRRCREESANERHAQNRHVVRKTKVISFQDPFPEPRRARATKPDQ